MKLIICIIQDKDKEKVSEALNKKGYRVTMLPSTGAFFRRGNATMMIGVEDDLVDDAIETIKTSASEPEETGLKRATLFVLDVDRFEQV